ncbi:uncharacterized protein LOC116943013 [Petromyzon marinus]|uniref:uncharacterized protein LOC116943013 n=1 Tax=Petromyzon marinus TaxID=7757 RepID=UPI003F6E5F23
MAYTVTTPVLEPSSDFPAWLEAQGVNEEVAQAMNSELGIRDYGVLRACIRDGLVRAELLATARDRLPFGFYAVLRQVVKALQGTEPHDPASSPGDVTLGGLVDVLLALFSGLSRELLLSVQRLGAMENPEICVADCTPSTADVEYKNLAVNEELPSEERNELSTHSEHLLQGEYTGEVAALVSEDSSPNQALHKIKLEDQDDMCINGRPSDLDFQSMNTTMGCISHTSLQMPEAGEETWAGIGRETVEPQMMPIPQYHPLDGGGGGGQGVIQWGEERPYSCKMCVQTFTSEAHLNVHLRTHMATRPFRCVTCGRCFSNSSSLNVHERTHMVEKPYCCSVCAQTFSHLSSLKRHQRTHTGEKPYHCDVCGQAFTNKRNMKYHRSKHEEMALPQ